MKELLKMIDAMASYYGVYSAIMDLFEWGYFRWNDTVYPFLMEQIQSLLNLM